MIKKCTFSDFESIYSIINEAAQAYRGVIPDECWHDEYMSRDELKHEINNGVDFWGYEDAGELVGVMGIQPVHDVILIRHAYVRTAQRNQGIGARLLAHLRTLAEMPILIAAWADAVWATSFYEQRGFELVSAEEKDRLLHKYWKLPERQIKSSVVLKEK